MSEIAAFSNLVSAIYDAALDTSVFPQVMEQLCVFLDAAMTTILSEDVVNNVGRLEFSSVMDMEWLQQYFEEYMHINPVRSPALPFVTAGDTFNTLTYLSDEEFRNSRYYKEWFAQKDLLDTVSTILERSSMNFALLSAVRHERQGYATPEDFRRMGLVAPHVRRALSIGHLVALKTFELSQFEEVVAKTAAAVLFVRSNGTIIYANPSAVDMMRDASIILERNNRLMAVDQNAQAALAASLAAADGHADQDAGAAILLARQPAAYVAHVLPMSSGQRAVAGTRLGAVAAVFIRPTGVVVPSAAAGLTQLYGLTTREFSVLMSIVAENNVTETAAILGLSSATVRTHLNNIFRKTDVRKQSELVALTVGITNPFIS